MEQSKKTILTRPDFSAVYNINEPDGGISMLDKELSGCTVMFFTGAMDMSVRGQITLDGKLVDDYIYKYNEGFNLPLLGVFLRGYMTEYGQKAVIRAEGFKDKNGAVIDPTEFVVTAIEKVLPSKEYAAHEAVALQAAEEGIVLLKNDNDILPLKKDETLNFFGKGLFEFRVSAVGAGRIHARYTIGLREAVLEHSNFKLNTELDEYYRQNRDDSVPSDEIIKGAKKKSDVAFVIISRSSGENIDNYYGKGSCLLTDDEESLIANITSEFNKSVLILNVGYPIDLTFLDKYKFSAIIFNGYGGMMAGKALVKVLDGRTNPSGKLPYTWAKSLADIPADKNFYKYGGNNPYFDGNGLEWIDTVYEEDIYVGYRYFDTFKVQPAFMFGHGLSYTNFSIKTEMCKYIYEQGAEIKLTVKNTGKTAGKEVVQAYVSKPDGKLEKPSRELVAFEKTKLLAPDESQSITIFIENKSLASYDEQSAAYVMENGKYSMFVGSGLTSLDLAGTFGLKDMKIVKQVKNRMQAAVKINAFSKLDKNGTYPTGKFSGIKRGAKTIEPIAKRNDYAIRFDLTAVSDKKLTFKDVQKDIGLLSTFVNQLTAEEMVRLTICSSAEWGMENVGEAGRVFKIDGREIPDFIVADGNSGVNIKKRNIGMPSGVTMCASFNRELIENIGLAIGEEAKENGVNLILAPGMNIQRHPLNGRHPEYFSEDPYLGGMMAGYYCKGLESAGVGGCYKHCIANNCETGRKRNQSVMTERALREIYFKIFEIAMDVDMATSIMTAYNGVNGRPTSADPDLILGLFREECGFDGYVMTDWATYDSVDVVDMVNAGNSWITPGSNDGTFTRLLESAAKEGKLDVDRLKENVFYLLQAVLKLT